MILAAMVVHVGAVADLGGVLGGLAQVVLLAVLGVVALAVFAVLGAGLALVIAFLRDGLVWFVGAACGMLAAPLIALARICIHGRSALDAPLRRTVDGLRYSSVHNDEDEARSRWAGWDIIGPLVYLALFVLLAAGDFYLTLQRIAALFGLPSLTLGGQQVDVLIGVLWVAMVATFGAALLDLHGLTPIGRPWHNASPRLRAVLLRVLWACLALTLLAGALFWLWGQFAILNALVAANTLAYPIQAFFGVLLNVAVVLSGWAAFTGIGALVALALMTLRLLAAGLHALLTILVALLNGLARLLTALVDIPAHAGRRLYNWMTNFEWAQRRYLAPLAPFEELPLIGAELLGPPLPAVTATPVVEDFVYAAPEQPIAREARVRPAVVRESAFPARATSILGVGQFGAGLVAGLATSDLFATRSVLAVGTLDDGTTGLAPAGLHFVRDGMLDISPPPREVTAALSGSPSPQRARDQLGAQLVAKLIQAQVARRVTYGQVLVAQELAALDDAARVAYTELKRRRAGQKLVLLSSLPQPHRFADVGRDEVRSGYAALRGLWEADVLEAALLLDPRGPFAVAHGEQAQAEYIVLAVDSLLAASGQTAQTGQGAPLAELATSIGNASGFVGLTFARGDLALANSPGSLPARRGPASGRPLRFDLMDLVSQTSEATRVALEEPEAAVIAEPIPERQPFALVYTLPLAQDDPRWLEFTKEIGAWLTGWLRAGGSAKLYPKLVFAYAPVPFVQVSALYPLPAVPAPLREYLGEYLGECLSGPGVPSDAVASNGHVADAVPATTQTNGAIQPLEDASAQ